MGSTADSLGRLGTRDLVLGGSLAPRRIGLLPLELAAISNRLCACNSNRRLGT